MRNKIGMVILIGVLAHSPGLVHAGSHESHSLEQLVVEMANTPAEHAALAAHYRAKAADHRAEAAEHERMGAVYASGKLTEHMKMKKHCEKIAASNMAIAADYEDLAKAHEAESKKTP